ncbi:TonB-dependent receptor [Prolixibacter sp. NT017]|uniref:TonB-dependent receptor n=1 Tax=Prolixibacter sp. NT017 TaxID=2652390 RepID=UPI001283DDA6|nr:TonB-dependent receptor [Prolixibacter sp. NT017]GET27174.1 collagen-binding protein [Prolixibacter sp. NT017]
MKKILFLIVTLLISWPVFSQQENNGVVKGRVFNASNNQPVPFANVVVFGTNTGTTADINGNFKLTGLTPGFIKLQVSSVGFQINITESFRVTNASEAEINIPMEESTVNLDAVTVKPSQFRRREESPVSLRSIGIDEIEKNPGGNRDISKVIQSYPGVSSTPAFRNDVIVRGGGPSENRFFLDDVEIPNLNHFATQGASGGPVGIINVDFIREVDFYSGAFPADRGNALSSVLEFKQKDGNSDKMKYRATLGASDLALTLDGPLSKNTTAIFSARRSYLQFLFSALGLPFLPTYNDFQFKVRTKIDDKNEVYFTGIGALDQFKLNTDANKTEEQRYILGYLPVNKQWSYAVGAVYKHYREKGYDTWVVSQNRLNNIQYKYQNNVEKPENLLLDYDSYERETRFRFEHNYTSSNGFRLNYGAGLQYAEYFNRTYRKNFINGQLAELNYRTDLSFWKYSFFGQASQHFLDERLVLSLGLRADANNYSAQMNNLLQQLSPRFSASYNFTPSLSASMNTGRYYQLPSYTTMGYRDNSGALINRENGLKYISVNHYVAGITWQPQPDRQFSVEGFYKGYNDYPFSVTDSVSLASKGADYGVYGDEEVLPVSNGRAYGFEILGRDKDILGFNTVFSYTYVRSEFREGDGKYIPAAWDNQHIFNITANKSLRKNWDFGFKWRYVGGAPYTPWDMETSSLRSAWNARGRGYLDYSRYNQLRLKAFHQLDFRVDKSYYFKKWSLMLYVDVQNAYNFKADQPADLILVEDANGNPVIDPNDPSRYELKTISPESGTVLPTIGVMIEF